MTKTSPNLSDALAASRPAEPRSLQPMDPQVSTIQPGGGVVMRLELAWGVVRRWLLRRLRPSYVQRMLQRRQGDSGGIPIDPIDPRDIKYYRNQPTYWWAEEDDPFRWRDALPFVRVGLAELILMSSVLLVLTVALALYWWPLAIPSAVVLALVVWFFRDPRRVIPDGFGVVVSPADGKVVQIDRIDDPVVGPAVQVGIFLSIFDVHANRASTAGRVIAINYKPGKFLNALRPQSAQENERLEVTLEELEAPYRVMKIRQITGQFARRIVCWVRPGDVLQRGEMFGMIKLGSRTEVLIPDQPDLEIMVQMGQRVRAGASSIARYAPRPESAGPSAGRSAASASAEVGGDE